MRIVYSGRGAAYIIVWESGYIQSENSNVVRSGSLLIERPHCILTEKELVIAAA